MYVYEALAQALYDNDIHEMFGVVGDANLFIIDSFVSTSGGRYVATSSEGGAVMAAFGYAQVSGKLGAATVTHGPGLTNTVTALVEAQRGGVPLLVLTGLTTSQAVESTARSAHERNYHVVVVTDAIGDLDTDAHSHSVTRIFPKIAQLATTEEVLAHL